MIICVSALLALSQSIAILLLPPYKQTNPLGLTTSRLEPCASNLRRHKNHEPKKKISVHVKHARPSPELAEFYTRIVREFFPGRLPEELPIFWAKRITVNGHQAIEVAGLGEHNEPLAIFVDQRLENDFFYDYARLMVIHGMAHLASKEMSDDRPGFIEEMHRLCASGAMDLIW